jgi:hypothetical protein
LSRKKIIMLPLNGSSDEIKKSGGTRELAPKKSSKFETIKLTAENPPRPQVLEVESEESDESDEENYSPSQTRRTNFEWTPRSSYLRSICKLVTTSRVRV